MPLSKSALIKRAKSVRLLAMDVDGVLTGGEVIVLDSGEEIKLWNAKDRLSLALVRDRKIPLILAWITGRQSKTVAVTAADLGVSHVIQKCHEKKKALSTLLTQLKIGFNEVGFIGDDLIDLSSLKSVGFAACPVDAAIDVKKHVHYISPFAGGQGVVRDVLEFILRAQNKWEPLVQTFFK